MSVAPGGLQTLPSGYSSERARVKMASSMGSVNTPVFVFWRLG